LNKKLALALENGLTPIYCCGEPLEIRNAGTQANYVINQLKETVFQLSEEDFGKLIIAYEPIWAIGTGVTATTEQAQEMHKAIRDAIAEKFGKQVADDTSLLYGGSCNAKNANDLFANPDVDGGLIGGASLKPDDFIQIINAY
jgi:triosephosphate isomerase